MQHKHRLTSLPVIVSFIALSSCGGAETAKNTADTDTNAKKEVTTEQKTESGAGSNTAPADAEKAQVAFKVNGVAARTAKAGGNDNEAQLGMVNLLVNNLSLDLLGDDPARPHRGWLHFSIDNFRFEPATYMATGGNNARFTRYETANAGGGKDYAASSQALDKGSSMTIQFTSVVKNDAAAFGEEWLVSGTFSAKMLVKEFSMAKRSSTESVEITEGKFENVPLSVLGRKK